MNDKESTDELHIDIQAVNITLDEAFSERVTQAMNKLRHYYSGDVITAEVRLREETHGRPNEKSLRISYGVPGTDIFAEELGDNWDTMLHAVTAKLKHQLDRKFVNSQNSYRNQ